jgi:hypothetical protein
MANPSSSSPVRQRRPERDNTSTTSTEAQGSPGQQATNTGGSTAGVSTSQPSWQTSGAQSPRPSGSAESTSGGDGVAQKIRNQANSRLTSQKDRALNGIEGVTEAFRRTTQSLREQQHDSIARYVEQVAGQMDRLTQNLRQKDVGELLDDAQRLARREPALFVGSAFALGLLVARFLKSSPPDDRRTDANYGEYRYRGQRRHGAARSDQGGFYA